jgi:hypothetical protein
MDALFRDFADLSRRFNAEGADLFQNIAHFGANIGQEQEESKGPPPAVRTITFLHR